ncbi:hypothetical protein LTR64_006924 [Lithohypha guttulata]|uniref:uncharacterized protein n=1 Tax=Lithohypha guttulata TaxID=1690604 RepID=UPI002DE0FCAE|nr:hypothetical protein LTR51_004519 [Lithohypha guttulata]
MLRINRSRLVGLLCLTLFVYFLVFTESGSSAGEFRANTEAGLARKQQREQELPLRGHLSDEDLTKKTNDELQGILSSQSKEQPAKDTDGNSAGSTYREPQHNKPSVEDVAKQGWTREEPGAWKKTMNEQLPNQEAEDASAAGQKAIQKPKSNAPDTTSKAHAEDDEVETGGDPGKDFARVKLMEYLKNPVVIFSKSYCPHSKKAKHLLLEVYKINPKPVVVELDMLGEHVPSSPSEDLAHDDHNKITLGKALQDLLAEITGRKTVPNIVVGGGHSIGGNDNIWEMHETGHLAEEIKKFGGRRIVSVDVQEE